MVLTLLMFIALGALVFVIVGLFLGVAQHILRGILLAALGLVLLCVLWGRSATVAGLVILVAVALSARAMFFRAP